MDNRRFTLQPGEKAVEASWYCTTDTSGHRKEHLCLNGACHLIAFDLGLVEYEGINFEYRGRGICDGWCRPENRRFDLRTHVREIASRTLMGLPVEVPNTIKMDPNAEELFRSDTPLIGTWFDNYYDKHGGGANVVCVGGVHVYVYEDIPSTVSGNETVTHTITAEPCNSSCQPVILQIPERMMREPGLYDGLRTLAPSVYRQLGSM